MWNKIIIISKAYLNLIKEWFNFLSPQKKELFNYRYEICQDCIFKDDDIDICTICSCPLKAKTKGDYDIDENGKSIDGCPKKYW
jgi:hypothetical protein